MLNLLSTNEYDILNPLVYLDECVPLNSNISFGPFDMTGFGKLIPQNVSTFSNRPSTLTNACRESTFVQLK